MDNSPSQPSTSKRARESITETWAEILPQSIHSQVEMNDLKKTVLGESDLPPNVQDDEEEIARLEAEKPTVLDVEDDDEREAKIEFKCELCEMREMVHYYGKQPPFVLGIEFLEDTFIMRDPFQPPPPRGKPKAEYFVMIGALCSECKLSVCKDSVCSFYYLRTFCLNCAEKKLNDFPDECKTKISKQLLERKNAKYNT